MKFQNKENPTNFYHSVVIPSVYFSELNLNFQEVHKIKRCTITWKVSVMTVMGKKEINIMNA